MGLNIAHQAFCRFLCEVAQFFKSNRGVDVVTQNCFANIQISRKAVFSMQKETREQEIEKQSALELAFEDYRNHELDSYIAENYPGEKYQALIER